MSAIAESQGSIRKPVQWMVAGGALLLILVAMLLPNLRQSRFDAAQTVAMEHDRFYSDSIAKAKPQAVPLPLAAKATAGAQPDASTGHKIIRTSSLEMVVRDPAEISDKIAALAEGVGGYLVSANGGGQNASAAALTIRVPAARYEEARAEIRKLGLRVESERIDAQDVTRQYVDEDANLRNLRAEESQYLTILKQATTVKDLLAVSEKLSEVRGQIEQQQAEFNALSQQIETVAMSISLRSEQEAQVLGLNWRPLYQVKLALRDGLDSLATYATAMTTIVFYLPTALLWMGTIFAAFLIAWRLLRWAVRRWFGWKATEASVQG